MTTTITIFLLLCLAAAVMCANHYRRRWARAEDTNRFLVEQINQLHERLHQATQRTTRKKSYYQRPNCN
ncbi:MAG: hypothetical protein LUC85_06765 [Bacteroidales bacterium]|nr:hypothetical protein [Bacteroidales bacterium]